MATVTERSLWTEQTPKSLRKLAANLYSLADELLKRAEEMDECGAKSMQCRGMASVSRGMADVRQFVYLHSHVAFARTAEYRNHSDAERSTDEAQTVE